MNNKTKLHYYLISIGQFLSMVAASVAVLFTKNNADMFATCTVVAVLGCGTMMAGFFEIDKERQQYVANRMMLFLIVGIVCTVTLEQFVFPT